MDCGKVGALIRALRREKNLTQRQLAEQIGVSDRTVSKWECGRGAPDVTLLRALSAALNVNIEGILAGELPGGRPSGGSMKKAKYFYCPVCGEMAVATGNAQMMCCGRTLEPMTASKPDEEHQLMLEKVEDEWYVTTHHPMERGHSLTFVALATGEDLKWVRVWPEWDLQLRFPKRHGLLLWHCSRDGLFAKPI